MLKGIDITGENNIEIAPKLDNIIKSLRQAIENESGFISPGYYCTGEKCYRISFSQLNEKGFMCSFSDISLEKEQIRESESFYELIPDLLCVIDENMRFTKINNAWKIILGYEKNEIIYLRRFFPKIIDFSLEKYKLLVSSLFLSRTFERQLGRT